LEDVIVWDRRDYLDHFLHPGKYALDVDPIIDSYKFSKVLMDGGSSINILYLEMLHRMKLS
jgi:hypothetical protein